jgi:hypothetical protein
MVLADTDTNYLDRPSVCKKIFKKSETSRIRRGLTGPVSWISMVLGGNRGESSGEAPGRCRNRRYGFRPDPERFDVRQPLGNIGLGRSLSDLVGSGGAGIRTLGTLAGTTVFKTGEPIDATPSKISDSRRIKDRLALPLPYVLAEMPPDLAEVVAAWPGLDEPTRAAVLGLIRARR